MFSASHNQNNDTSNFLFNTDLSYSKRIIIDFTSDANTVIALKTKFDTRYPDCENFVIEDYQTLNEVRRDEYQLKSDSPICIYVMGHCEPGSDVIICGDGNPGHDRQIHFTELARLLLNIIGNDQAVINLLSCGAARGKKSNVKADNGRLSFASKLHACIYELSQKDTPVIARMHYLAAFADKSKSELTCHTMTMDLSVDWDQGKNAGKYLSKQYGSKVIFCKNNDNYQIRLDAYSQSWKREVMKALVKLKHDTRSEDKEEIFDYWLSQFEQLMPKDILDYMKNEVDKPDTALRQSDCCLYSFFMGAFEYKKIKELIEKGNKIVNSPYTKREITHVAKLYTNHLKIAPAAASSNR